MRKVFVCHASEDKIAVVEPLVKALAGNKISHWYDRAEIHWGDSLTGKVNEGLRISEFVLVVLSKSFLAKPWPRIELESALNREASTGQVVVLPLLVGNPRERREILRELPILNHKLYVTWDGNPNHVVHALKGRKRAGTVPNSAPLNAGNRVGASSASPARWSAQTSKVLRMPKVLFVVRCMKKPPNSQPPVLFTRTNPQWVVPRAKKAATNRDRAYLLPSVTDNNLTPQELNREFARMFGVKAGTFRLAVSRQIFESRKFNPTIQGDTVYRFRFVFATLKRSPAHLLRPRLKIAGKVLEWKSLLELRHHVPTMTLNEDVVLEVRNRFGDSGARYLSFKETVAAR